MEQIIISAISGAAGGNVIARMAEYLNLGTIGNSVVGAAGGVIGQQILAFLGGGGELNIGSIVGLVASGALGGGLLQAAAGTLKKRLAK